MNKYYINNHMQFMRSLIEELRIEINQTPLFIWVILGIEVILILAYWILPIIYRKFAYSNSVLR